jgi:hypothetical protein
VEPAQGRLPAEQIARLPVWLVLVSACAPDWKNADLQLDVTGFPFADDDRISVCVEGVGLLESAATTGVLAYPGIPPTFPHTVAVANDEGLGGSVEFPAKGYRSIEAGEQSIAACPGSRADEGTGLLLAVRLLP